MFTDIATARRHAFSLSRSLMVVTFVIAIGQQYGVITAEDADGSVAWWPNMIHSPDGSSGSLRLPALPWRACH